MAAACQSSSSPQRSSIVSLIISRITFAYQLLLIPIMQGLEARPELPIWLPAKVPRQT